MGLSIHNQVETYLECCEFVKRMTTATILNIRKALERFIRVAPQLYDLAFLTNSQFDSSRASLAREGKSGKTINNYAHHVVCCVQWLHPQCMENVLLDLGLIERAEEDDSEISYYTPEEVALAFKHRS